MSFAFVNAHHNKQSGPNTIEYIKELENNPGKNLAENLEKPKN
jgi:hypothetical protein